MQIKTFFADCDKAIEEMIATLQDKPACSLQQRIVRLTSAEEINMVATQYKQEPTLFAVKDNHKRMAHYLNLLSLELKAQGNPLFLQQAPSFFFLALYPLRLCCMDESKNSIVLNMLEILRAHLQKQMEQLINGWRIFPITGGLQANNKTSSLNWVLFTTLIGVNPAELQRATNMKFSEDIFSSRFNQVTVTVPGLGFLTLRDLAGINIPHHQQLCESIFTLLGDDEKSKNNNDKIFKTLLKNMTEKLSAPELILKIDQITSRENPPTFCAQLSQFTNTYLVTETLLTTMTTQITKEKNRIINSEKPKDSPQSCLHLINRTLPQNIIERMKIFELNFPHLLQSLKYLNPLNFPYNETVEKLFNERFLNISAFLEPIQYLLNALKETILSHPQAQSITEWFLAIHANFFTQTMEILSAKRFRTTLIMLCESIIDFCQILRSLPLNASNTKLLIAIQDTQPYLFNAALGAGYFEKALYWLEYYDTIVINYDPTHLYHSFFHQGEVQLSHAVLAHRIGNIASAVKHLANAKLIIDNAPKSFVKTGDFDLLTKFIKNLGYFLKRTASTSQLIIISLVKRSQHTQAIELNDIMENLFSKKTLYEAIKSIKAYNTQFKKATVDWNEINTYLNNFSENIAPLSDWLMMGKSFSTINKHKDSWPNPTLKPKRSLKDIDPDLIGYRRLQDYCLQISLEMMTKHYWNAITTVTLFLEHRTPSYLHDHVIRLLISLHMGYAVHVWPNAGSDLADTPLRCAEYYTHLLKDKKSFMARESAIETSETKFILKRHMPKIDFQNLQKQYNDLLLILNAKHSSYFYWFECQSHEILYQTYTTVTTLQNRLLDYRSADSTIEEALPKLLYDVTVLKFRLAYEIFTQVSMLHNNERFTLAEVNDNLKVLCTVSKKNNCGIGKLEKTFKLVIESLDAFEHQQYAQALSLIHKAEESARQHSNIVQIGALSHISILSAMQNANQAKPQPVDIALIPLLEAAIIRHPKNASLLFTAVIAYSAALENPQNQTRLVQHLKDAVALNSPHAIYCYARALQKGEYGLAPDPKTGQQLLEGLANSQYYRAAIKLARVHSKGLFGVQQSDDTAENFARLAKSCPEFPAALADKIDDEFNLNIFIPFQFNN